MIKTDNKIKILNTISIIVYVLVYHMAFFDIEEMLVTHYYEEMYHMNKWDEFTMIMFWVGIPFTIELKLYRYLNVPDGRPSILKTTCMSTIQFISIVVSIYMSITSISVVEEFDRRKMTINFFCCVLVVLMAVQVVLWLCKIHVHIKGLRRAKGIVQKKVVNQNIDIKNANVESDEKSITYKIMRVGLIISIGMYLIVNLFEYMNLFVIMVAALFGIVAVVIPVKLFLQNILEDFIQKKKYICAIIAIVIYVITFNNVYRHLLDRYLYNGNFETIWINAIIEIVNIVCGCIAILHVFIVYRRKLKNEEFTEEVVAKNKIKQWKYLIAYLAFMLLAMPIKGETKGASDYVYRGVCYEIIYQNIHEYEEPEDISGIEVKLFGNVVYACESK